MASGNDGSGEAIAGIFGAIIQLVFSLTFPLLAITLCGLSYLLAFAFHMPEFGLWAFWAHLAIGYAKTNGWVLLGLIIFALAALPLAWVAYREQELKASNMILAYVIAGIVIAFTCWLRTAWPYDGTGWQIYSYGFLLLMAWSAVIEAAISTIGIVAHVHRNRPQPARRPAQQPHGAPRQDRGREPDTI
ncbi:MAG TPA: hypothetical protein VNE82_04850 [Candidatus Binataceae bacterium]|nr:hypothetical protein [Candidatus Binataceae bacterium]